MKNLSVSPIGRDWDEVERGIFTPEEIAASDMRVALMVGIANTRAERGMPPKKIKGIGCVKQTLPKNTRRACGKHDARY